MLGKIEGGRRRGWQRMRWLDSIVDVMDMSMSKLWSWWWTGKPGVLRSMGVTNSGTWLSDWTELRHSIYLWIKWISIKQDNIDILIRFYFPSRIMQTVQFSSVAQSCPTLCIPMNRSMPGLPVHHKLPEFTQTHVLRVGDAIQPSHSLLSPSPPNPQSLPASRSFPMSQLFTWGGQSIGASASASVLPMITQNWSPLGWTGWISLQSSGLQRVFSNTTVQKHQFFGIQLSS